MSLGAKIKFESQRDTCNKQILFAVVYIIRTHGTAAHTHTYTACTKHTQLKTKTDMYMQML